MDCGCNRHEEIDRAGSGANRRSTTRRCTAWSGTTAGSAHLPGGLFVPGTRYGSIYYTPGYSNGGWLNFSESNIFVVRGIDGDATADHFSFRDYDLNGREQFAHLRPELSEAPSWRMASTRSRAT